MKYDASEATSPAGTRSLWKVDTTVKAAPTADSQSSTRATTIATPFTTKIGGFFTSRGSISSISSSNRPPSQPVPCQPSYNESDTSSTQESVVEPISPASEAPAAPVVVHGSSVSSSTDLGLHEHVKPIQEPLALAESILPIPTL